MTDEEIDKAWSDHIALLVADAFLDAKLLQLADLERAKEIIAEEILVRLLMEDRPNRANWKYSSN